MKSIHTFGLLFEENENPLSNLTVYNFLNAIQMNSNYMKSLRIIYFALAMGIAFFMMVTLFLNRLSGPFAENEITPSQRVPFIVVLVVLTLGFLLVYFAIYPKKMEAIKVLPTLDKKLAAWRELCILQGALIEAPSFFALVLFLLLGIYTLLVWPIVGIILFWMTQPTREKLISGANLTTNEIAEFDNMD